MTETMAETIARLRGWRLTEEGGVYRGAPDCLFSTCFPTTRMVESNWGFADRFDPEHKGEQAMILLEEVAKGWGDFHLEYLGHHGWKYGSPAGEYWSEEREGLDDLCRVICEAWIAWKKS